MARTIDLESAARDAAGNWMHFDSFFWRRSDDIPDADQWTIVYTRNRDSRLLDESNAQAIAEEMKPFLDCEEPDVIEEHHGHWGVGWVDGYAIRVFRPDGTITQAFEKWIDIAESLSDYPVLDEDDYSRREHESTLENIGDIGGYVARRHDYELPDDWESAVFSYLWDNDQREVKNLDDQGGYPSEESIRAAFDALGYPCADDESDDESDDETPEDTRIIPDPGQMSLPFGDSAE